MDTPPQSPVEMMLGTASLFPALLPRTSFQGTALELPSPAIEIPLTPSVMSVVERLGEALFFILPDVVLFL
jgi:hypothetical protein